MLMMTVSRNHTSSYVEIIFEFLLGFWPLGGDFPPGLPTIRHRHNGEETPQRDRGSGGVVPGNQPSSARMLHSTRPDRGGLRTRGSRRLDEPAREVSAAQAPRGHRHPGYARFRLIHHIEIEALLGGRDHPER